MRFRSAQMTTTVPRKNVPESSSPSALSRPSRRGATVVEFALVAPLIFLLIFASIEFGRMQMTLHGLNASAREGCRTAVTWNASQQSVEQAVRDRMVSFGIVNYSLTTDPDPTSKAGQWEPITVRVTVNYDDVSWLPAPRFLRGVTLAGTSTLPQESDQPDS